MEQLSVEVSHYSCRCTLQVSQEHRQVIAYKVKERSSHCAAQIQEGPAVAPLGMVPWVTAEEWGVGWQMAPCELLIPTQATPMPAVLEFYHAAPIAFPWCGGGLIQHPQAG